MKNWDPVECFMVVVGLAVCALCISLLLDTALKRIYPEPEPTDPRAQQLKAAGCSNDREKLIEYWKWEDARKAEKPNG